MLTPKKAAQRACVSLSLIYAVIKQGRLPAFRVGCRGKGKYLIREEDLDGFLSACRVEPPPREDDGQSKWVK